ncbi:DNA primase [Weeksella sp. HMSC059D05]|nr:CHC2 zinc finger domain-containing protein [Weeksella sp. HMSC059D05]OFM84556.1 hypothetical protein HMPREF2660_08580 [Weeksella sp. HMSC059D05]
MGLIKSDFIDQLLADADIVEIFEKRHKLIKKGTNYFCLSPLNDENTPSCVIDPDKQMFFDKSANVSGNIFTYFMKVHNLSFVESVKELARIMNRDVEYESDRDAKKYEAKINIINNLRPILQATEKKYKEELYKQDMSSPVWQEIKKRGYNEDVVKQWGLGYAPGNQFLYKLLAMTGNIEDGKKLGLINNKNNDKLYNRLTYSIFDKQSNIIGFASRSLSDDKKTAKWMNPSNNDLYNKSKEWYGFNFALKKIAQTKIAWIVEGYNDVIAWHLLGINNTISPYGKEFSQGQINELKKHAHKAIVCLDHDKAGIEAMVRNIPKLLANGINVEVCFLPGKKIDGLEVKVDPDDFSRLYKKEIEEFEGTTEEFLEYLKCYKNGFEFLIDQHVVGDSTIDKAVGVTKCVRILMQIEDRTHRNIYRDMLISKTKFKASLIKEIEEDIRAEREATQNIDDFTLTEYTLPSALKGEDIKTYLPMIKEYGFFQAKNQIWMQIESDTPPFYFKSISNFSIEIIQHMNDDKFPKKLLQIKNTRNIERIFDAPADALNNVGIFTKHIENQGNYRFKGKTQDLERLKDYLFDKMGTGRAVEVMGQNPEGFFVWNNGVTIPGVGHISMDENGIFKHNDVTYYVPSANSIYASNHTRYITQKKVIVREASVSITEYLAQLRIVHRGHSISGILFAIASAFQDFIAPAVKGFPLLLLYGQASSGKDQLSNCLRSFFGIPQSVIALGAESSTAKAKVREFAQIANVITHLSEYRNGDKKTDEMLKGIWDRNGYKYGTIESSVSSNEVPILSSALVTGNEFPNDEALITRFLWEEMMKDKFTQAEKDEFHKLEDMSTSGISSFMVTILLQRPEVEKRFLFEHRLFTEELITREAFKDTKSRIINNHAVIGAMYEIFKETIRFPFTRAEMLAHFDTMVNNQKRRLESESVIAKFWQRFVHALRGTNDRKIWKDRDFKLDGNLLYIRWTDVYNAIQPTWYMSFEESCPNRNEMKKSMMDDIAFVESSKSTRFGNGKQSFVTTALVFDVEKIKDKDDILYAIQYIGSSNYDDANQLENNNDIEKDELPF